MKRIIATGAVAALAMVGFAGTAAADGHAPAYGEQIKSNFDLSYGQVLNAYRGAVLEGHGDDPVFPSAVGAKAFWNAHKSLFQ